jgi:hypothetical protein
MADISSDALLGAVLDSEEFKIYVYKVRAESASPTVREKQQNSRIKHDLHKHFTQTDVHRCYASPQIVPCAKRVRRRLCAALFARKRQ